MLFNLCTYYEYEIKLNIVINYVLKYSKILRIRFYCKKSLNKK